MNMRALWRRLFKSEAARSSDIVSISAEGDMGTFIGAVNEGFKVEVLQQFDGDQRHLDSLRKAWRDNEGFPAPNEGTATFKMVYVEGDSDKALLASLRQLQPWEPVDSRGQDLSAEEQQVLADRTASTINHTLAMLFLRLGPPPEAANGDFSPVTSGGGGAQQ